MLSKKKKKERENEMKEYDQTKMNKTKTSFTERHLTSSTVFLLFVSLKVSSTKLSHRPLQSSGSSATDNPYTVQSILFILFLNP